MVGRRCSGKVVEGVEAGVEVEHEHLMGDASLDGLAGFGEGGQGAGDGFVLAAVGKDRVFGGGASLDLGGYTGAEVVDTLAGES